MHVRSLSTAVLLLLAAPLLAQNPERRGGRRSSAPVELKNLTFKTESFDSKAVGSAVEIGVYLPKDYDAPEHEDTKWPLVIWLHGMWEDHMRFHHRGGAAVLDRCVGDGTLPPCVFVSANGGRTSMYFNRKDQRWEDLITVDLLAHMEQKYRVSAERERRAIMGVSMGGMAALRIAFTKPDLFGAVGAHSSAVFGEDPEQLPDRIKSRAKQLGLDEVFGNPIQKEPWEKANPLLIAKNTDADVLKKLRIYFDAGTADPHGFAAGNELLHEVLDHKGVPHTWRLIEGGGHSWGSGFQDNTLPYSFAVVGAMFRGKPAATPAAPTDGGGKGDSAGKK